MKVLFTLLILSQVYSVMACSCAEEYPSASRVLKENHSVFIGIPDENSRTVDSETRKTRFTVIKNFKNARSGTQLIYSIADSGANCGVEFKRHQSIMLVKTNKYQNKVWTSVCAINSIESGNSELTVLIKNLARITKR